MSARRGVVAAAALAGVAVALVVTLLLPPAHRASGVVVLTREGRAPGDDPTLGPAAEAAAELLESRVVAESVVTNLRLDESAGELLDRVDVDARAQSSLLRLSVEAEEAEEARRVAQELAEVFTVLYNTRFAPGTTVSVWEAPAAEEDAVSPRPARNLALGALAGALLGLALVSRRRRPPSAEGDEAAAAPPGAAADEEVLARRLAGVTERELALARRAAELALRERELAREELVLERHLPPAPPPAPESQPPPEPEPFAVPGPHDWRVADVERLLAEYGDAAPDRRDELGFYLESFRDVAEPDGRLPAGVAVVVEDEFAPLIERARARAAARAG